MKHFDETAAQVQKDCESYALRSSIDGRRRVIREALADAYRRGRDSAEWIILIQDALRGVRPPVDGPGAAWIAEVAKVVAKLDAVTRERDEMLRTFSSELDAARAQITEHVMEWARKAGCVYCGEDVMHGGPDEPVEARRAAFAEHTKVCAKHPMREVEGALDSLSRAVGAALVLSTQQPGEVVEVECDHAIVAAVRDLLLEGERPRKKRAGVRR